MLRERTYWLIVGILVMAGALRLYRATYGYNADCLAVPDEAWFYTPAVSSIYAANVTIGEGALDAVPPFSETLEEHPELLLLLRLGGAVLGLLTVALTLRLGLSFKAGGWWLAGAFVALAPWFVNADRWIVRFDLAALCVAFSALFLLKSCRIKAPTGQQWLVVGLQLVSAILLVLVAPPLWWLAIGLVALQPHPKQRIVISILLAGFITLPALQSPWHWLKAAQLWDEGTTAAVAWSVTALALWRWRRASVLTQVGMGLGIMVVAWVSFWSVYQLPNPTPAEWQLVHWLQERIPDQVIVNFDAATWHLHSVVACPTAANIQYVAQPLPSFMPFLPGNPHASPQPQYIVTTNQSNLKGIPLIYTLDNGYFVGRNLPLPNPVDVHFGDLFYLLGYELVTPTVPQGGVAELRVDYQFDEKIIPDFVNYSIFIHVVLPGQPGDKVINFNAPVVDEIGIFGPRRLLINKRYRWSIPLNMAPRSYDVIVGFYKPSTGENLGSPLTIGQLHVTAS